MARRLASSRVRYQLDEGVVWVETTSGHEDKMKLAMELVEEVAGQVNREMRGG